MLQNAPTVWTGASAGCVGERPKSLGLEQVSLVWVERLNLLEKVLGDAKPVISSTVDSKYDIASRPTELSSDGYVDITD